MNSQDEILKYVLKKENLPATLDIISRAGEIRRAVLEQFWEGLKSHVRQKTPQRFAKLRYMRWESLLPPNRFDGHWATLYYHDRRLPESAEALRFCFSDWRAKSSFYIGYGIMWWLKPQTAKSRLLQLPAVVKLRQELNRDQFKSGGWWLGESALVNTDCIEDFLKRHASNPKRVDGKACEGFWQLVEVTYDLVAEANRAIQRAGSK